MMTERKKRLVAAMTGLIGGLFVLAGNYVWSVYGARSSEMTTLLTTSPLITQLETAIADGDTSPNTLLALAEAYVLDAQQNNTAVGYERIEELVEQVESRTGSTGRTLVLRAHVAMGRHQFADAQTLGQQAIALDAEYAPAYGVVGDAALERGAYTAATAAYQRMSDLRPDFNAFVRIAYLRELYGDFIGAERMYTAARSAAPETYPTRVWLETERAKLLERTDSAAAKTLLNEILTIAPDYTPALAVIARQLALAERLDAARDIAQEIVTLAPTGSNYALLGDIHMLRGDTVAANQSYALAELAIREGEAFGITIDYSLATFLSERGLLPAEALLRAERAFAEYETVRTADTLAWALYQTQQYARAYEMSVYAHTLAPDIANVDPLVQFHTGAILFALGEQEMAAAFLNRALALHPFVSIPAIQTARVMRTQL